jgi:hypothetical protein
MTFGIAFYLSNLSTGKLFGNSVSKVKVYVYVLMIRVGYVYFNIHEGTLFSLRHFLMAGQDTV